MLLSSAGGHHHHHERTLSSSSNIGLGLTSVAASSLRLGQQRRLRSKSWGSIDHELISSRTGTAALSSSSSPKQQTQHRKKGRHIRGATVSASFAHLHLLPQVNEAGEAAAPLLSTLSPKEREIALKLDYDLKIPVPSEQQEQEPPAPAPPAVEVEPEVCWNRKDIWEWYNNLPWLAGMNYLPRTAVNFVEMWDETSFDPKVIDEELKWAADKLGYNTLRTNLPMVLYEHDAEGFTRRVNKFLRIAARNGFAVMLCPLDDCEFSGQPAQAGPQPDPVPGLHNSRAIGSPGRHIVMDPSQWFRVEEYIRYVVRQWGQDQRVFLWDLYNEPGNPWIFEPGGTKFLSDDPVVMAHYEHCACALMEKVFCWARDEHPRQPLTTSAWHMPDPFFDSGIIPLQHPIDQRAMQLSDVISIHAYCDPVVLERTLNEITSFGKPILLTEWMARQVKSTYDTALPTLKDLKVGAYQWGLVQGKTQTYLPWPHVAHNYEGEQMWWHDVLDSEGNFHSEQEGEVIRSFVYPQNRAIGADVLLIDSDSLTSLETAMEHAPSTQHFHMQHENVDVPDLGHGEDAVIPSVCSITMAQINSMAAQAFANAAAAASEHHHHHVPSAPTLSSDAGQQQQQHQQQNGLGASKSAVTFASHMASQNMEGLDLELGGIEF